MPVRETNGYEFDWFAIDSAGCVGHFSTAGYGAFSTSINVELHDKISDYFKNFNVSSGYQLKANSKGRLDDWIHMASCGLYSYDWQHWEGPYQLIAIPMKPVKVNDLPQWLQVGCKQVVFQQLMFTTSDTIIIS